MASTDAVFDGVDVKSHARMQRKHAAIHGKHHSAAPAEGENQTAAAVAKTTAAQSIPATWRQRNQRLPSPA